MTDAAHPKFIGVAKLLLGVLFDLVPVAISTEHSSPEAALWVPIGGAILAVSLLFVKGWRLVGVGMFLGVFVLFLLAFIYVLLGGGAATMLVVVGR